MGTNILSQLTRPSNGKQPNADNRINGSPTRGAIKLRMRFLRATFGDILNLWPQYAREEHTKLSRRLRQIDAEEVQR